MFAVSSCVLVALLAGTAPQRGEPATKDPAIEEFNKQVKKYMDLHNKVEHSVPPIDKKRESDPARIVNHQKALSAAIGAARPEAARGDIFRPDVQPVFLKIIKKQLSSGKGPTARAMILGDGNPKSPESPAKVDLSVNAEYPAKAPLSTVPPSVLLSLPRLPDGLEYRFVGRHLILYDASANLIVDVLPNAIR